MPAIGHVERDLRRDPARVRKLAACDAAAEARHGGAFLAVRIGGAEYGIALGLLHEVRAYEPPAPVAHAPIHVMGVARLRGALVPMIDLRLPLCGTAAVAGAASAILLLDLGGRTFGAVVDAVIGVVELAPAQIDTAAADGGAAPFVTAIGRVEGRGFDRCLRLLDIEAVVGGASGRDTES